MRPEFTNAASATFSDWFDANEKPLREWYRSNGGGVDFFEFCCHEYQRAKC